MLVCLVNLPYKVHVLLFQRDKGSYLHVLCTNGYKHSFIWLCGALQNVLSRSQISISYVGGDEYLWLVMKIIVCAFVNVLQPNCKSRIVVVNNAMRVAIYSKETPIAAGA